MIRGFFLRRVVASTGTASSNSLLSSKVAAAATAARFASSLTSSFCEVHHTTTTTNTYARCCDNNNHRTAFSTLQRRCFASSSGGGGDESGPASSREELVDILTREHEEEVDNETTAMPPDLKELKTELEKEWKIVDDGAVTKMYRTSLEGNNNKIQISFHCQDTIEVVDDVPASSDYVDGDFATESNERTGGDGMDDDGDEIANPVRFTVTIAKAGKLIVMSCVADENASVQIQSVATTASDNLDAIHDNKNGGAVDPREYQGPEFTELAEDLQDSFHNYLEDDVGITEDLASFVTMYSDYREQVSYVEFLRNVKTILS